MSALSVFDTCPKAIKICLKKHEEIERLIRHMGQHREMWRTLSMRVFVASWFFPPNTSSEGIVTYKLLRNSRFFYDVVCSSSNNWGYAQLFAVEKQNICTTPVNTEDLHEWQIETIRLFEKKHAEHPYDLLMTRAMPRESLLVGLEIKKKYPDIPWICSLADPVANNPYWLYEIRAHVELPQKEKEMLLRELRLPKKLWRQNWIKHPNPIIGDQFFWKDVQDRSFLAADCIIAPCEVQLNYMISSEVARKKSIVVPHSFDSDLFSAAHSDAKWEADKIHLTYTGYSDALRSLQPFIEAVNWIAEHEEQVLDALKIHIFGNYPSSLTDMANARKIEGVFDFQGDVSYLESLAIMQRSDWLLHVDAWFEELAASGGSIFFAGKLADYMGAERPILAITGERSPAADIVCHYGGCVCSAGNTEQLARTLIDIVKQRKTVHIQPQYRRQYDAKQVAAGFDQVTKSLLHRRSFFRFFRGDRFFGA